MSNPTGCPQCGAPIRLKKASPEESGRYGRVPGIRRGDLILRKHKVGGGQFSARTATTGDAPCSASGLPVT